MAQKLKKVETKYTLKDFYVDSKTSSPEGLGFDTEKTTNFISIDIEPSTQDEIGINFYATPKDSGLDYSNYYIDFSIELSKLAENESIKISLSNGKTIFKIIEMLEAEGYNLEYYQLDDNNGVFIELVQSNGLEFRLVLNVYSYIDNTSGELKTSGSIKITKTKEAIGAMAEKSIDLTEFI